MRKGVENCLKYLARQWSRKERTGNKDFKKGGGEVESKGGCLKKGGWNPIRSYDKLI